MSGPPSDLPPGLEWLSVLEKLGDFDELGWGFWLGGIATALLFNVGLLLLADWVERRHDRQLARMEAAAATVMVFNGRPPAGAIGAPHLIQAAIVMAPAPLGRFTLLLRRVIGGRVITRQRDLQRTRRLALLRLREQAVALGAGVVAGVELSQIGLSRGRFALIATGTALIGSTTVPAPQVTESVGAEPSRPRRELWIAIIILILAAAISTELDYLFGDDFNHLWRRWFLHSR